MLSIENIKKEYGEAVYRKNPKAILVEYLQYELLDSIFKQKGSEKLSFIGGTAIRIVYQGNRFSEDLDFDNFGLSFSEFENLLNAVILDMEKKGFVLEFRFVEKGAYHCYIKFPKLLFQNNLSKYVDEKILLRIDTVHKKRTFDSETFSLNGFSVYRKILVNPPSIVLSQKIMAILERKREKGRDFYDVSYLFGRYEPDYSYLKEFNINNREELKKRLLSRVSKLDLKKLSQDVSPFLINPDEAERVLSFKEYVEQKL